MPVIKVYYRARVFFRSLSLIYLILGCTGFSLLHGLSLVAATGGYSLRCEGFSLQWLLLLRSTGSVWARGLQ